ncbi:hypothetical protein OQA88_12268 [Cercophora sp. LCS_1]
MVVLSPIVVSLLIGAGSAQAVDEHIWSSVAWVLHGERTPLWGPYPQPALTPWGAQQMFSQGSLLRARYLDQDKDEPNTEYAPIVGIERNAIDNSQLNILTSTEQFLAASAQAFSQGLYPPITQAFSNGSGGMDAAAFPNGSIANYPLGGYQYANTRTASNLDFESVWIGGHLGCTAYTESLLNFRNDDIVAILYNNTKNFYQNMWRLVLHEAFPSSMANFANAWLLWDYASFRYNHNNATRETITAGEMSIMARFASTEQRNKNGNITLDSNRDNALIRAIAGRTMAAKTLAWFKENMRMGGATSKINLAFTTIEPFVAWFALSELVIGEHAAEFKPLPEPGAMMVFELFSIGTNVSEYPDPHDLYIRFLYRNGTDQDDKLTTYALFNSTESPIPFTTFLSAVQRFHVSTVSEWCNLCGSVALFCSSLKSRAGSSGPFSGGINGVSPVVAGVVGAAVTLAVAGLIFLLAVMLGAIRFHRGEPKARNSTLGFKGAERMASDTDLAYAKGGARHERTGSWELRGGKGVDKETAVEGQDPTSTGVTIQSRDLTNRKNIDDDAISEFGQTPVKPREF